MQMATLLRHARLLSGLVLLVFVTGHLGNLALGIVSLSTVEAWRATLMGPWQTDTGQILFRVAVNVHTALGLYAIATRRSLAMSRTDIVQLVLGLLTPPLLIAHLTATHFAYQGLPDLETNYGMLLTVYWVHAPFYAFQQLFVVLIVWVHAALGLYAWLVVQAVWRRIGGFVLPLLFAVPILALIGFADAGNEVLAKYANDAEWRAATGADAARVVKFLADTAVVQSRVFTGWCLLVLVVAGVLAARMLFARSQTVEVAYDAGLVARGRRGLSILELSEAGGIPHARVCSARGRCGTCRVRIDAGAASLSPPNDIEQATLARVKAGEGVRLACQTRVLAAGVAVTRLLPAYADASAAREPLEWVSTEDHAAPAGPGAANPASAP